MYLHKCMLLKFGCMLHFSWSWVKKYNVSVSHTEHVISASSIWSYLSSINWGAWLYYSSQYHPPMACRYIKCTWYFYHPKHAQFLSHGPCTHSYGSWHQQPWHAMIDAVCSSNAAEQVAGSTRVEQMKWLHQVLEENGVVAELTPVPGVAQQG